MNNNVRACNTCENAIFCPTWVEWKCTVFCRSNVYEPSEPNTCDKYKPNKSTTEAVCHCEDCESQVREDIE